MNESHPPTALRTATIADRLFIKDLQLKHSRAIGWIGGQALDWYLENGCIELVEENSDAAGFILYNRFSNQDPTVCPVYQLAICTDLQRRHHGLAAIAHVERAAAAAGRRLAQMYCRCTLPANEFWCAAGYTAVAAREGGTKRKQMQILWRKTLNAQADLWQPPSSRRRNTCGPPQLLPRELEPATLLEQCRSGQASKFLRELTKSYSSSSPPPPAPRPRSLFDHA